MTSKTPAGSDPAPQPKRRTFSPKYQLRIVAEYDAAFKNEKGAVLRCERLSHSHVKEWQVARDAEALAKLVAPAQIRAREPDTGRYACSTMHQIPRGNRTSTCALQGSDQTCDLVSTVYHVECAAGLEPVR